MTLSMALVAMSMAPVVMNVAFFVMSIAHVFISISVVFMRVLICVLSMPVAYHELGYFFMNMVNVAVRMAPYWRSGAKVLMMLIVQ